MLVLPKRAHSFGQGEIVMRTGGGAVVGMGRGGGGGRLGGCCMLCRCFIRSSLCEFLEMQTMSDCGLMVRGKAAVHDLQWLGHAGSGGRGVHGIHGVWEFECG